MSAPKRIQARRSKGWRLPPNTVIVTRASRYGNPFKLVRLRGAVEGAPEDASIWRVEDVRTQGPTGDRYLIGSEGYARRSVVDRFTAEVLPTIAPADLERLRDHDVACSCDPDDGMACHGDALLRAANLPARFIDEAGRSWADIDCEADPS